MPLCPRSSARSSKPICAWGDGHQPAPPRSGHAAWRRVLRSTSKITAVDQPNISTPHIAVAWGGTAFNWMANRAAYITPERPDKFWFETYSASARRFKDIALRAGADVLISNHTIFDGSKTKLPAMATRKPGDKHPYVVGADSVARYLTVAEECAKAGLLRTK